MLPARWPALACLALAAPALAQPVGHAFPHEGLVFDDFVYRSVEAPYEGTGYAIRFRPAPGPAPLYGANVWCLDLACGRRTSSRFWYRYLWDERSFSQVDPKSRLDVEPDGDGALVFIQEAGTHEAGFFPQQIASGFTARTGVWAAEVTLSALPDSTVPQIAQSFWTVAPHRTLVGAGGPPYTSAPEDQMRTEVDFEWNNWFGSAPTQHHLVTGFFEHSDAAPETVPMRADAGEDAYSCRYRRTDREEGSALTPAECVRLLREGVPGVGRVPVSLLVRFDGRSVRFELLSRGWGGELSMASRARRDTVPSQEVMAAFSQYLWSDEAVTFPREERFEVDWFYYTPDAARSHDDVLADVAALRRRAADATPERPVGRRVSTVRQHGRPLELGRPYAVVDDGTALEPTIGRAVEIAWPRRFSPGRPATVLARLGRLGGAYRVAWAARQEGQGWRDLGGTHGHRLVVRMPGLGECLDLRATVTALAYGEADGRASFAPTGDVVEATERLCVPVAAP